MIVRYVTVGNVFYIFMLTVRYGSGAWPGGGTQYLSITFMSRTGWKYKVVGFIGYS